MNNTTMNGAGEFEAAPDDISQVIDPRTPSPPPASETALQRVLNELLNMPKEQQQRLYRFLYDCGCRINE